MKMHLVHLGLLVALGLAPARGQSDSPAVHRNVVIVLDASGSMRGPLPGSGMDKMTAAKAALKQVVQQLPPSTRIGLLVFSAAGIKDHWVYPLGPRDDEALLKAIDLPMPNGDTPLGRYIKIGADRLLEERAKNLGYGDYRLLIVTDGEAQDKNLVDRYTPEVIARGITVDVIGVAMNSRHTLATKVHSYRAANDATALRRALTEVLAEVGGADRDQFDAEAFATLAPIPDQVASALLQALATTGNQPIGQKPRAPAPISSPRAEPAPPSAQPAPPGGSPPAAPPSVPAPPARKGFSLLGLFALLVLVSAVLKVLRRR